MGGVRRRSHDVQVEEGGAYDILADNYGNLWGIHTRLHVGLSDDFVVYGTISKHLSHLWLCLQRCQASRLSLNPAKCAFSVTSGALLGHVVSKEGIAVDPNKISAIIQAKTQITSKGLN